MQNKVIKELYLKANFPNLQNYSVSANPERNPEIFKVQRNCL